MNSFISRFTLPAFLTGSITGILFYHGLAVLALKIDIEKAEPVLEYYGTSFALGAVTACLIFVCAFIFQSKCYRKNREVV